MIISTRQFPSTHSSYPPRLISNPIYFRLFSFGRQIRASKYCLDVTIIAVSWLRVSANPLLRDVEMVTLVSLIPGNKVHGRVLCARGQVCDGADLLALLAHG